MSRIITASARIGVLLAAVATLATAHYASAANPNRQRQQQMNNEQLENQQPAQDQQWNQNDQEQSTDPMKKNLAPTKGHESGPNQGGGMAPNRNQ